MKNISWRKWTLGFVIAIIFSLLAAGGTVAAEAFHWKLFMSVFCTAMFTHMTAYLIEHPVDSIEENQMISRDQVNAAVAKIPSESISSDNVGD